MTMDPLAEVMGDRPFEVHSPHDGHEHVTDADGSIKAVREPGLTVGDLIVRLTTEAAKSSLGMGTPVYLGHAQGANEVSGVAFEDEEVPGIFLDRGAEVEA